MEEQEPSVAEEPRVRRRIEDEPESREGRAGCIAIGAGLGVAVGILFTLFGLPPLLNSFFGETTVDGGATFAGDRKTIRVVAVQRISTGPEAGWELILAIRSERAWRPPVTDFELEYSDDGGRRTAVANDGAAPETSLDFRPGEQREILLRFPSAGGSARPVTLHLKDPRVGFDLRAPP